MFSGGVFPLTIDHNQPPLTMYQTEADSLNIQPDHQSGHMYVDLHHHNHDLQYELANYSSSGCESSPSSYSAVDKSKLIISSKGLTQRSISSHSLPPMMNDNNHNLVVNYQPVTEKRNYQPAVNVMHLRSTHRLVDLIDSCSIRRVFSTGDLQLQMHQQQQQQLSLQHGSSLSKESSSSSIIEGMLSKARPYSPEEKKEKIERYKTKRSHRNFNKKIKYACRKTLADSRPRIRGRFARNNSKNDTTEDESFDDKWAGNREYEAYDQWGNNEDDDNNWLDLFNSAWLLK